MATLFLMIWILPTILPTFADASSDSTSQSDLSTIIARFYIDSPTSNGNYTSRSIPLNASVHYYAVTHTEQSVIPYQSIGCVYQLDGGDWRNLTLYSASSEVQSYLFGNDYLEDVLCKYSAILEIKQEGTHNTTVRIIPDKLDSWFDNTNLRNFTIYFNVENLPSLSPSTTVPIPEFQSSIVLVITLSTAFVAAVILKSKKRNASNVRSIVPS